MERISLHDFHSYPNFSNKHRPCSAPCCLRPICIFSASILRIQYVDTASVAVAGMKSSQAPLAWPVSMIFTGTAFIWFDSNVMLTPPQRIPPRMPDFVLSSRGRNPSLINNAGTRATSA